ncbi:S-adenosyl-L-methionine-dependent methyltransferase [Cladochytrium replicatum]|nr:S-adenosyl-L-methionine-dependent methyltransferase [Cladochytrium replicatum]
MSRPEHTAPPEIFYNEDEARKYTQNTRIQSIQTEMTLRALELLNLPEDEPALLLDIGCGSGLSSEILEEEGHVWVDVALDRELDGDLILQDIGQGLGFRPGTFDGAISVSVIQWLCNADKSTHVPRARLLRFFETLYSALKRGGRAVFQFYPQDQNQVEMIVSSAMKTGFTGGIVVDYPNSTKAKKWFLCLFAGYSGDPSAAPKLPSARDDQDGDGARINYEAHRERTRKSQSKATQKRGPKDRTWVKRKKDLARMRGNTDVANDSKYTARKRGPKF